MNLQDLKKQFESDTTKRAEQQEKTISRQYALIKQQEILINQLENRCLAITRGTLCMFCSEKRNCEPYKKRQAIASE